MPYIVEVRPGTSLAGERDGRCASGALAVCRPGSGRSSYPVTRKVRRVVAPSAVALRTPGTRSSGRSARRP